MLATLTGTAPFSLTGLADAPDEAWIGSDTEAPGAAEAAEVVEAQAAGHPAEVAADHAQSEDAPQESLAHDRG